MSVHSRKSSRGPQRASHPDAYTGVPPESWNPEKNDRTWGAPFSKDPSRADEYKNQLQQWLSDPWTLDERWRARAKRELNENPDPAKLREEVEELRKLVIAEKGLRSRMDDHFLLAFLRSKRHEIKPALTSLVKYYRMRKVNSQYFELFLPSENTKVYQMGALNLLEGYDLLGRFICYFTANFDPQLMSNFELIKMLISLLDTVILDPRVQVAGLTILVNLKQQSMAHAKIVTVHFLKLMLQIFQGSFPVRMKLVLLCHGSFLFRATFAIIRPFIPEKFKERIHIMGSDTKKLQNFIDVNMIPTDLGGELSNIRADTMMERILLNEDNLREWNVYGFGDDVNLSLDRMPSLQFDTETAPHPEAIRVEDEELRRRIVEEQKRGGSELPLAFDDPVPGPSGGGKLGVPSGGILQGFPNADPGTASAIAPTTVFPLERSTSGRPGTAPGGTAGGTREVSSSHASGAGGLPKAASTHSRASAWEGGAGGPPAAAPKASSAGAIGAASGGAPKPSVTGALGGETGGAPVPSVTGALGGELRGAPKPSVTGALGGEPGGASKPSVTGALGGESGGAPIPSVTGALGGESGGAPIPSVTGALGGVSGGSPKPSVTGARGGESGGAPKPSVIGALGGESGGAPISSVTGALGGESGGAPIPSVTGALGGESGGAPKFGVIGALGGESGVGAGGGAGSPPTIPLSGALDSASDGGAGGAAAVGPQASSAGALNAVPGGPVGGAAPIVESASRGAAGGATGGVSGGVPGADAGLKPDEEPDSSQRQ